MLNGKLLYSEMGLVLFGLKRKIGLLQMVLVEFLSPEASTVLGTENDRKGKPGTFCRLRLLKMHFFHVTES